MSSISRPPIALTTVFHPPSTCSDVVTEASNTFWQYGRRQLGDPDCFPDRFTSIIGSYYSPGLCPSGWTSAGAFLPPGTVFDAICCPQGYDWTTTLTSAETHTFSINFCSSKMAATLTNVYSTSVIAEGPIPENATLSTVFAESIPTPFVWADIIQVRWEATDTQVISLMSSLQTAMPQSTFSSLPQSTDDGSSYGAVSHTSPGIIAGIVIAVVATLGLIGGLIFFLVRRRSRSKRAIQYNPDPVEIEVAGDKHKYTGLIESTTPMELPANQLSPPFELDSSGDPHGRS